MYVIIFLLIPLRYQNDPLDNIKKKMTFMTRETITNFPHNQFLFLLKTN